VRRRTVSIFSTVYDTAAARHRRLGGPTDDDGVNQLDLASIARQVGVRDPQLNIEASGLGVSDRNAELLLTAPFDLQASPAPSPTAAPSETPAPSAPEAG
jgi:hypothetical protein